MGYNLNYFNIGDRYTIYYNDNGDLFNFMCGKVVKKDENSVLISSIYSPYKNYKLRYKLNDKSSKIVIQSKNKQQMILDVQIYDFIPWNSPYEIQGVIYKWDNHKGGIKLFVPDKGRQEVYSEMIIDEDNTYHMHFDDNTVIKFEGGYNKNGIYLSVNNKNILEYGYEDIYTNISVRDLNYSNKEWFSKLNRWEYYGGFRFETKDIKEFNKLERVISM